MDLFATTRVQLQTQLRLQPIQDVVSAGRGPNAGPKAAGLRAYEQVLSTDQEPATPRRYRYFESDFALSH